MKTSKKPIAVSVTPLFWCLLAEVCLAVNPCEPPGFPPPSFRTATYDIRDYGAVGDGKTSDTEAINKAIERCSSEGGGDVVFPPGIYVTASVHLRSHVRLVIRPGSVIQGADSGYDLPEPNANDRYQDYGHSHFHNALLWGEKVEDCAIMGGGEINGKHLAMFDPKQPDVADKMISIVSGRNIQFENLNLKNGGHFTWLLDDCENVTIAGINLKGSRDAIDLMGCRNVQIHGCKFMSCIDDTLGIKSDWALGRKIQTRNIYAWDCDFDSGCNALQFGSETAGDFHNVNIWDIRVHRAEKAGIGITSNDGGDIDGVTYRNITMSDVANPVFILVTNRLRSGDPAKKTGVIRNVCISDVTVTNCRPGPHHGGVNPITLSGRPESMLQHITLENIRVTYPGGGYSELAGMIPGYSKEYAPGKFGDRPASGLYARNIDGLTLRNISFSFASRDGRPPLVISDTNGLIIDGFQSQKSEAGSLLKLDRVRDSKISNSSGITTRQGVPSGRPVPATAPLTAPLPDSLTPPPPTKPHINGPSVFGVRPGSPFLYSIPATGKRPMTFSAEGLPTGLICDSSTGQITGSLPKAGNNAVTLIARNTEGEARKSFRIIVGEEIALTPPMGWNSYNVFDQDISRDVALNAAKAIKNAGLDQHGWIYVNMDDGWQGARGGPNHALQPDPAKFTDIKSMVDQIHGMGLKAGIYHTPWVTSYGGMKIKGRAGATSDDPEGAWADDHKQHRVFGKFSFVKADAGQFADWGFDYLKYDWNPISAKETEDMEEALRHSGRDIVFSLSNSMKYNDAGRISPHAQLWRTSGDIKDTWGSIMWIGFRQLGWGKFLKPGHFNDPDMLCVGHVGWGHPRPSQLTPDEQYTHISLWCLLSAPLLMGCDLTKLDPFTLGLLTNDEVLAVDQDALCKAPTCPDYKSPQKIYIKELEDGTKAVGFFNTGDQPASMTLNWKQAGLSGKQTLRDLWRQKDLGDFMDQYSAEVPSHGVLLLKVSAVPNH